jgi:cytochrome c peroxidase
VSPVSASLRDRRRSFFLSSFVAGLFALLSHAACADPKLGLPRLEISLDNPSLAARVKLGRKLFMDRRLSRNGTMSCGMCHVPEQGFTTNEMTTSVGIEGRSLRRNAPTVLNVSLQRTLFHDGRETSLERQVWMPLLAADEMGNTSRAAVVARIRGIADYSAAFARVFPSKGIGEDTIAAAIASYERTLMSASSRFDRWFFAGQNSALSASEREGFELFRGKAGCSACHIIGERDALFTDHRFHNTGVGSAHADAANQTVSVPLGGGETTQVSRAEMAALFGGNSRDEGRLEVTRLQEDRWAYKTPSLRNVALTAPYMHDGSLATLREVIEFYDRGGMDNPGKDPLLRPLHLSYVEKQALEAFLQALTGENVGQLATEARAAFRATGAR